jgi:hypothetical protein
MDPHKRSVTIVVTAGDEVVLGGGRRYATDATGYRAMLVGVRQWPERTWAVEGCRASAGKSPADWCQVESGSWVYHRSCPPASACSLPGGPQDRRHRRALDSTAYEAHALPVPGCPGCVNGVGLPGAAWLLAAPLHSPGCSRRP